MHEGVAHRQASACGELRHAGNFYAIVEPQQHYDDVSQLSPGDIQRLSPLMRARLNERYEFVHPDNDTIRNVSHVQWTGRPTQAGADARNAVF